MKFNFFKRRKEKDLIIGNLDDATDDDFANAEPDEKDYAAEAFNLINIYSTAYEIDTKLLNKSDARRIEQIKRYSLRVAHIDIKQVYEENFFGDLPQDE